MTTSEFIEKAKIIHSNENLDYSKVEYINNRTKVCIVDPIYGEYWQTPSNHLKGQSHPMRRKNKISKTKRLTEEEVINRFKIVHNGEGLDYSKVKYVNMHTKVCIIDPLYGEYMQEPIVHLKGCVHPQRAIERNAEKQRYTTEFFKEICHKVHPEYILDKIEYKASQEKVCIICPKHGEFFAYPDALLQGKGCPKCGNHLSYGEDELYEFIKGIVGEDNIIKGDRKTLCGLEIDILVPSKNIGFEFDGLRWHSEKFKNKNYHLDKTIECEKKGINLIHIFEDEWIFKKEIVLSKIRHILKCNNLLKIGARKCKIKNICKDDAKTFLDKNHIQGYAKSTIYLGAFYENELIGVMSFIKMDNKNYILNRFASSIDKIIQGLFTKMITNFIEQSDAQIITTFLDRRWCHSKENNIYKIFGMELEAINKPNYSYTNGRVRKHKFGFRKQILHKKYGFPLEMTELEMATKLGYTRIWDCGLFKYVWRKDNNNNKNTYEKY